jgi:hypothetical protein
MKTIAVILSVLFAFQNTIWGLREVKITDVRSFGSRAYDVGSTKGKHEGDLIIRREITVADGMNSKENNLGVYMIYYFKKYSGELKCYKMTWLDTANYVSANADFLNDSLRAILFYNPSTNRQTGAQVHISGENAFLDSLTNKEFEEMFPKGFMSNPEKSK